MKQTRKTMMFSLGFIATLMISFAGMGMQNAVAVQVDQDNTITLGGLFPLTGTLAGGGVERDAAARMAVKAINADDTLLAGKTLELLVRDTGTDPATGVQVAGDVISLGAVGLIGAASSGVSSAIAQGPAKTSKVPQISYSSTSPSLSDKTEHPYFLRVVPPDSVQGVALANIVNEFGWDNVATLASSDDYGLGGIGVFETSAAELGITVATAQRFAQGATDVKTQLQAIADSGAKVIVLNVIVGDAQTVFSQAADVGLTAAEGYVWVGTDGPTQGAVFESDAAIKANMQGMTIQLSNRQTTKKQMRIEVSMMGNVMQKTVVNQTKGYNEMQGQKMEMKGEELENTLKDISIFPELEIDSDQISLKGIVSVDGVEAYEIKWSDNKTFFYAVEGFLKLQTVETMEIQGQIQSSTTYFSDYKTVEGIRFPHLVRQDMGPQKIDFQVKSIILNEPMPDSLFE